MKALYCDLVRLSSFSCNIEPVPRSYNYLSQYIPSNMEYPTYKNYSSALILAIGLSRTCCEALAQLSLPLLAWDFIVWIKLSPVHECDYDGDSPDGIIWANRFLLWYFILMYLIGKKCPSCCRVVFLLSKRGQPMLCSLTCVFSTVSVLRQSW